jgi:hypothetical protein
MVNVYIFREDGTTPEGYIEIDARYRGRLIKAGGTPLEISGAARHSHIASASSVSTVSPGKYGNFAYAGTKASRLVRGHNHLGQANVSRVAEASNFPEVKKLRLVGRDASDWNYKLPPGSIVFRRAVPETNWLRTWSGEAKFIKIEDYEAQTDSGSDSGRHQHLVEGYTAREQARPGDGFSSGGMGDNRDIIATYVEHGHKFAGPITGSEYNYSYWGCGLIKSNIESGIPQDSYLLFDGLPDPAYWEVVPMAKDRYLKTTEDGSMGTGGSVDSIVHDHSGSMLTEGSDDCFRNLASDHDTTLCSHQHQVGIHLAPSAAEPLNVRFVLARAKFDLGMNAKSQVVMT